MNHGQAGKGKRATPSPGYMMELAFPYGNGFPIAPMPMLHVPPAGDSAAALPILFLAADGVGALVVKITVV